MECDGLVVPGVGAFTACVDGVRAVQGARGHRPTTRRRPSGAGHLRRHAGPLRARRRARRRHRGSRRVAGRRGTAARARRTPHGVEHRRGRRRLDAVRRAWRASGSTSSTPTACASGCCATHGRTRPPLVTWASHGGDRFVAAVENGPLSATQFHPEKSGDAGSAAAVELGRVPAEAGVSTQRAPAPGGARARGGAANGGRASEEERRERRTRRAKASSQRGRKMSPLLLFALLVGLVTIVYLAARGAVVATARRRLRYV